MANNKSQIGGFTLIETLIYAALTTLIVTFSIFVTFQLINSATRVRNQKETVDGQKLLTQKIYYTLQSVSAINSPAAGATSTTLSVDKLGYGSNPVVINTASSVAWLKRGAAAAQPITDLGYVRVQSLNFHQFDFSGRPAIQFSGSLFNPYTSTTVAIGTTTIVIK